MADMPDDEQPETFVQKAVKIGLITIPLMMYVSWAHKKFVPCPQVKCQQARPSTFKKSFAKGKRKNNKGNCQDSRPAKQENKRGKCENPCQDSRSPEQNYQDQLSWISETNENDMKPSKDKYMDYLKRSTKGCCESVSKHVKGCNDNSKTDCEQLSDTHQYTSDPCSQQMREGKTEADTCSQSNMQSETISPEAFDKLFEQHFQKCVDGLKQHKKHLENEIERLKEDCENNEKPEVNKNGNYLECLADLNLDKDFECDPNFHSKDADTPYVVKDYKCKDRKGEKSHKNETSGTSYLKCLTDLNMDKHFEEKQGTRSYFEEKSAHRECCSSSKVKGYDDMVKNKTDECETDSYNRTKREDKCETTKKDPCAWKTQEEELCNNETASSDTDRYSKKDTVEEYNIYIKAKLDDCGCDPHFNTKDSDKYGTTKGEPCTYRSAKEDNTEDDALKDFWHACGPPKGLRTGCQADGCNNPCDKRK